MVADRLDRNLTAKYMTGAHLRVRWQSGYAEACKALYVGSIPARTSNFPIFALTKALQGQPVLL